MASERRRSIEERVGETTGVCPVGRQTPGVTDVTGTMLAIVSKTDHYVCMFENQTIDMQEIRTVLTDAGHTAVGFATMAAKKANDVRLDFTGRYDDSLVDLRHQALEIVKRAESVRVDVEARVEPVMTKVVERLPQPAQKLIQDAAEAAKELQSKSYQFVVKSLSPEAKAPVAKKAAKTATPKPAAKTTAPKAATAKAAAVKATVKKVAVKKAVKSTAK